MPLHLQKLCVGAESVEDLREWIAERLEERRRRGAPVEQVHTTRMAPRRVDELLDGGSLYWVIKGVMQVRQRLLAVRPIVDSKGVPRCELVLDPVLVVTESQPRRPFQGWRYLDAASAPRDLDQAAGIEGLPPRLVQDLRELGLL